MGDLIVAPKKDLSQIVPAKTKPDAHSISNSEIDSQMREVTAHEADIKKNLKKYDPHSKFRAYLSLADEFKAVGRDLTDFFSHSEDRFLLGIEFFNKAIYYDYLQASMSNDFHGAAVKGMEALKHAADCQRAIAEAYAYDINKPEQASLEYEKEANMRLKAAGACIKAVSSNDPALANGFQSYRIHFMEDAAMAFFYSGRVFESGSDVASFNKQLASHGMPGLDEQNSIKLKKWITLCTELERFKREHPKASLKDQNTRLTKLSQNVGLKDVNTQVNPSTKELFVQNTSIVVQGRKYAVSYTVSGLVMCDLAKYNKFLDLSNQAIQLEKTINAQIEHAQKLAQPERNVVKKLLRNF